MPTLTLTWIGHSAFLLNDGEFTVAIDPFISGNPAATMSANDISPDAILLTHAHDDHVGDTLDLVKRTGATTVSTFELGEWLREQGAKNAQAGNHGGTIPFPGGTAKIVPAWHTSSYELPDGGRTAFGIPAGLVVRFGGKTLYFAGDTCLFGDMQLIGEEGLDVAVLPIGDYYTMGPKDAVRAAKFLNPGAVIPCHYNTFPGIAQDGAAFGRAIETETGARAIILQPGESVEL